MSKQKETFNKTGRILAATMFSGLTAYAAFRVWTYFSHKAQLEKSNSRLDTALEDTMDCSDPLPLP